MHGLALNVCTDMAHWQHIVPCGLAGRTMTSVEELLAPERVELREVQRLLLRHFCDVFEARLEPPPGEGGVKASLQG